MSEVTLLERAPHVNRLVRWELLPGAAQAAATGLSEREWSVLSRRLAGESLAAIAGAEMSKQAVDYTEKHALRKLAQLAGRALPCSVIDFVRATREAPAAAAVPDCSLHGRQDLDSKTALDRLADAFIAEAERGHMSKRRRAWYDRRARQLEARQRAE
jgi:hypothetical protein